jgi:hypothetical protein
VQDPECGLRKKWNFDAASGGDDGRAREDAHIRVRGRSKAWHRRSGPTCEIVVREGDRIVRADSYFASVEAALHHQARGVRFISVVKTATSSYPMKLLQSKVLPTRGDWKSYVHRRDGKFADMAVVWVDREQGCCQGSGVSRPRAKVFYLHCA